MSKPQGEELGKGVVKCAVEAAEKARKEAARASLLRQIGEVQGLIREANTIKAELNVTNSDISATVTTWTSGLSTYESCAMADVVVVDKFEGVAATEIQAKMPEPIEHMDKGITAASDAQDAINMQINKLNTYISIKGTLLSSLYGQLQAI